jgi:putative endonuclease
MTWYLYILECADQTLYTGITLDIPRRLDEHNAGTGSKYTRSRRPVRVVFSRSYPDRSLASKNEFKLKQMSRSEKLALIRAQDPDGETPSI